MSRGRLDVVNPGVVFTRDPQAARIIQQALEKSSSLRASFIEQDITGALRNVGALSGAGFVILDVSQVDDPLTIFSGIVDVLPPSIPVVVIGDTNDIRLYRSLINAGAAEYFFRPLVGDLIAGTLNKILLDSQVKSNPRQGKLIHFIGVRGGAGVTSIALRTAKLLSDSPPRPVFLMDMNLLSSDMAMQVNLQPSGAVFEALENAERIDDLFLERTLAKVSENLDLMSTLNPLNQPFRMSEPSLLTLFGKLAERYRYLVTEVPNTSVSDLSQVIRLGSTIVLVSDGRLASARDVARWRELLSTAANGVTLVHVLNRFDQPDALPMDQFARLAGTLPDISIPYSRGVAEASLLGLSGREGFEEMDRALEPLVAMIAGSSGVQGDDNRSWLDRILRRR